MDACVLANFSLCDTLLRLAEPPALFEPKWTEISIQETTRTLRFKLGWREALAENFKAELTEHFQDAWIKGFEHLIPAMTNDENDRHVAAAAVFGRVPIIVTFNLRDFRPDHLQRRGVQAMHPQDVLCGLLDAEPALVVSKLEEQARNRNRSLAQLLQILEKTVAKFTARVSSHSPYSSA